MRGIKNFKWKFVIVICFILFLFSFMDLSADNYNNKSVSYSSESLCTADVTTNNIAYPDYSRSECYELNGRYYYNICDLGVTCTGEVTQNDGIDDLITTEGNPYKKYLSEKLNNKNDEFILKLSKLKDTIGDERFKGLLELLVTKLENFETKYSSREEVVTIIKSLKWEVNNLKLADSIDDFYCDLVGGCGDTNSETDTSTTGTNLETGTSTTGTNSETDTSTTDTQPIIETYNKDDYIKAFSEDGYNLTLDGFEQISDGKYKVGNSVFYDTINITIPEGINPNSCVIGTKNKIVKVMDIEENSSIKDYFSINSNTTTIDLMCGFAFDPNTGKPLHYIKNVGCTKDQISKLPASLNSHSLSSSEKCNIVHKRLFLEFDSTFGSKDETFLKNNGYSIPEVTLEIDKAEMTYYIDKAKLKWNLGGEFDECRIETSPKKEMLGRVINQINVAYNSNPGADDYAYIPFLLSNRTSGNPLTFGSLEFYGSESGKVIITCSKKFEVDSKDIYIVKTDELDFTVIKNEDLLILETTPKGGDLVELNWSIHEEIIPSNCVTQGFNIQDDLDEGGRSGTLIVGGKSNYNFQLKCTHPESYRSIVISKNEITTPNVNPVSINLNTVQKNGVCETYSNNTKYPREDVIGNLCLVGEPTATLTTSSKTFATSYVTHHYKCGGMNGGNESRECRVNTYPHESCKTADNQNVAYGRTELLYKVTTSNACDSSSNKKQRRCGYGGEFDGSDVEYKYKDCNLSDEVQERCWSGTYRDSSGNCTRAETGFYSFNYSDYQKPCTKKPNNSNYLTWSNPISNDCPWECLPNHTQLSPGADCTLVCTYERMDINGTCRSVWDASWKPMSDTKCYTVSEMSSKRKPYNNTTYSCDGESGDDQYWIYKNLTDKICGAKWKRFNGSSREFHSDDSSSTCYIITKDNRVDKEETKAQGAEINDRYYYDYITKKCGGEWKQCRYYDGKLNY